MADSQSCCPDTASANAPTPTGQAMDVEQLAQLAKALAHPARVTLLKYLADYGTCYFGKLTDVLPLAPSTISQHVSILKDAGLILGSADERRVCYCVNPQRIEQLKRMIASL